MTTQGDGGSRGLPSLLGPFDEVNTALDKHLRWEKRCARPEHKFIENPPPRLAPPGSVKLEVAETDLRRGSNDEIAFYLHLKSVPGCTSFKDHRRAVMVLYIEPGSEAAMLFVRRMIKKLPAGASVDALPNGVRALLSEKMP